MRDYIGVLNMLPDSEAMLGKRRDEEHTLDYVFQNISDGPE